MNSKSPYNVWLTADLHIGHKNILKHQKNRLIKLNLQNDEDIKAHDEYIINTWLQQTKRGDHIYVLGDFIMANSNDTNKILNKLKSNGCHIHLIVGNHDKSSLKMTNMFDSIDYIKNVLFKKSIYPFLKEDFRIIMCHYPLKTWENKCQGSLNCYGHVHNNSPWIDEGKDLTINVGIDNPKCNYKLFSLEEIYNLYLDKLNGISPIEYIKKVSNANEYFIR